MNKKMIEDEKNRLIISQKEEITEKLYAISKRIEFDKSIKDFLKNSSYKELEPIIPEIITFKNKILIWINVKIISIFFMTLFLTGIFVLIGLIDAIMKEIKFSTNFYLFNTTRLNNETFFDNYNNINLQTPTFSLFFISSMFSNAAFNFLGMPLLLIIILPINFFCIFFGLNNFEFHISLNNINHNYTFKQFMFLFLMYIVLSFSTGIISPLPHKILYSAFYRYEKMIEEKKNKIKIDTIKKEDDSAKEEGIDINNKDISEGKVDVFTQTDFDEKFRPKIIRGSGNYNGYFLGYFLSILISMYLKITINRHIIRPIYNKEDYSLFFNSLILCHIFPILLSLIFYFIFSIIFESKMKKKEDKNVIISSFRCCGYIFYSEKEPNPKSIKLEGYRTGIRKFYTNCYCYKFPCFKCCECKVCCKCCSCIEWCSREEDLSQIENRKKNLYIIFRTSGKMYWLCNLLSNRTIMGFSFLMYFLELINIGFRPSLSTYHKNCEDSNKEIINMLLLLGIFLFYSLSILSGCIFNKAFGETFKDNMNEGGYLGSGMVLLIVTGSLVSFIFSLLIRFEIVSENIKFFLIPFSIGSVEYYKILLKKMSDSLLELEIVSADMLFSIYTNIWDIFIYILDIINPSYSSLILTQFIITLIVLVFSLLFTKIAYNYIKLEKLKRMVKEKEEENKEMEEKIKKEKIKNKEEELNINADPIFNKLLEEEEENNNNKE